MIGAQSYYILQSGQCSAQNVLLNYCEIHDTTQSGCAWLVPVSYNLSLRICVQGMTIQISRALISIFSENFSWDPMQITCRYFHFQFHEATKTGCAWIVHESLTLSLKILELDIQIKFMDRALIAILSKNFTCNTIYLTITCRDFLFRSVFLILPLK